MVDCPHGLFMVYTMDLHQVVHGVLHAASHGACHWHAIPWVAHGVSHGTWHVTSHSYTPRIVAPMIDTMELHRIVNGVLHGSIVLSMECSIGRFMGLLIMASSP